MVTIFCWAEPAVGWRPSDVLVQAIDEDGEVLAGHLSSSVEWAKRDIEHPTKLEVYAKKHPSGYVLEWVDDIDRHEGIQKAFVRNRHTWFRQLIEKGVSREEAYQEVWGWKDAGAV
jgi:hypothetical protein